MVSFPLRVLQHSTKPGKTASERISLASRVFGMVQLEAHFRLLQSKWKARKLDNTAEQRKQEQSNRLNIGIILEQVNERRKNKW